MQLYDSLRQEIVSVEPRDGTVRMYVCGITPYDTTHMGHARTYIVYDSIRRLLQWEGFPVIYVQNVTDIDDDILRKSAELGLSWEELGQRETKRYLRDMDALNVLRPDHYIKATDVIDTIIDMSQDLLQKGLAYERNGNVYYAVQQDAEFGRLAHMDYATMLATANERGNFPDDANKRDPLDFVLWQAAKPGEPTWQSPWGPGRPGWHIECSAIVLRYLGPQITIHGGGSDLQFPHHSCELVQAEHYSGQKPHVQAWTHVGMLGYEGEKMSKSLGNLVLVSDTLEHASADAIRLALLRYHYREPFEYTNEDIEWSTRAINRLQAAASAGASGGDHQSVTELHIDMIAALEDDFNTPECLRLLLDLAEETINGDVDDAAAARHTILEVGNILGLSTDQW